MQSEFLDLPNIDPNAFEPPDPAALRAPELAHAPRILLLYGSLRERSFSRLATFEAARLLQAFGAETRIFNPTGLPLPRQIIRRSRSCAICQHGRKAKYGAVQSVTAQ